MRDVTMGKDKRGEGEPKYCAKLILWWASEFSVYTVFENPYNKACENEGYSCC